MPASPTATPEHIKDVNTRYHDAAADEYDAKWGIDFGADRPGAGAREAGQGARRPSRRARSATRSRSAPGTGYFSLNLLQLGLIERADRDRHLARDARRAASAPPTELGLEVETVAHRGRAAAVRGRELRPRLRPRGPPPHPRPRARPSPSSTACCAPAARSPSAASPRATATGSRRCRSAPALLAAPAWRRAGRRRRGAARRRPSTTRRPRARARGRRPRLRPRRPARAARRAPASSDVSVRGEELLANAYGWRLRTLEATAEPGRGPVALAAASPSAATSRCSASTPRCSSPGCRRSSSTTSCSAPASRPEDAGRGVLGAR